MRNQMRKSVKIPIFSLLLLLLGYAAFGWLLAIYKNSMLVWWILTGSIAFGSAWFLALAWAIAAVFFVFSTKTQILPLVIGVCLIWALLMFIARTEVEAISDNKIQRFFALALVAALGMGLGWLADSTVLGSLGNSIMQVSPK